MKNIAIFLISLIFIGCGSDKDTLDITTNTTGTQNNIRINTTTDNDDVDDDTINKPTSDIYINEFLTRNIDTTIDKRFYQFSDWIELHNSSNYDIDISHYKLSDNAQKKAWSIPSGTLIKAKGYKIIWADKKRVALHANFSLGNKESILLYDENNELIDKVNYKKQKKNISYGRNLSLTTWGYMLPTFNRKNHNIFETKNRVEKPTFSSKSGFYDNRQTISLSSDDGDIYYTIDGETPTKNSSSYVGAINISKTTVIKAIVFKDGFLPSKVKTETYLINHESSLPVISITTDKANLYDDMKGIYVTGKNGIEADCGSLKGKHNFSRDWERPAHLEYFDENQKEVFELGVNLSIAGECSRKYIKKSFSIELDKKYGKKKIDYKLYPQKDIHVFKDFKLRTGDRAYMVSDMIGASLVADGKLNIDYQGFKQVQVLINGEYWGVYHLREKKGKDFIESNYPNVDGKNIDIIKVGEVKKGDMYDFNSLKKYITNHDLADERNYEKLLTKIDIDNYIDYMALMIYSACDDWLNNNVRLWKEKKDGAKWRWMLDDVDSGFASWSLRRNNFDFIKKESKHLTSQLFLSLVKNKTFKRRFTHRLNALLDTTFNASNVRELGRNIVMKKKPYLRKEKWANQLARSNKTVEGYIQEYNGYIRDIKDFANKRDNIVRNQLKNF